MGDANQDEQAWLADGAHNALADGHAGLAYALHHCSHQSTPFRVQGWQGPREAVLAGALPPGARDGDTSCYAHE